MIIVQGQITFDRSDGVRRVGKTVVLSYQPCNERGRILKLVHSYRNYSREKLATSCEVDIVYMQKSAPSISLESVPQEGLTMKLWFLTSLMEKIFGVQVRYIVIMMFIIIMK